METYLGLDAASASYSDTGSGPLLSISGDAISGAYLIPDWDLTAVGMSEWSDDPN